MLRIGIIGLGFMGKMHFDTYQTLSGQAKVAAIADVDPKKRAGDWSAIAGNIGMRGRAADLSGIKMYENGKDLIASPDVDVVDITLPTYLHSEYTLAALAAGKHVICEKPMALDSREARGMAEAAARAGRRLFIGQCIRFWPSYREARNIVLGGKWGKARCARFVRISPLPTWSWNNWLLDAEKSRLAALDFHIHDADFVVHLFGMPKAVATQALSIHSGGYDHVQTRYFYGDDKLVMAEGGWEYAPGYPFSMTFDIHMEKASLRLGPDGKLILYPQSGGAEEVAVPEGSGYDHELRHYVDCIARDMPSDLITPESAAESVRLIEAEVKSAAEGKPVDL